MTEVNEIGRQCAELLKRAKEQNATALTKANDLLAQRQEKLKPLLTQVLTALKNRIPVDGHKTVASFAKGVKYTPRALQYIVYGRPEKKERTGVRTLELRRGTIGEARGMGRRTQSTRLPARNAAHRVASPGKIEGRTYGCDRRVYAVAPPFFLRETARVSARSLPGESRRGE